MAAGRCFNCGKLGHWQSNCPLNCFKCGKPGHWAKACPNGAKPAAAAAAAAGAAPPQGTLTLAPRDGGGVLVTGQTFEARGRLKEIGLKWSKDEKGWISTGDVMRAALLDACGVPRRAKAVLPKPLSREITVTLARLLGHDEGPKSQSKQHATEAVKEEGSTKQAKGKATGEDEKVRVKEEAGAKVKREPASSQPTGVTRRVTSRTKSGKKKTVATTPTADGGKRIVTTLTSKDGRHTVKTTKTVPPAASVKKEPAAKKGSQKAAPKRGAKKVKAEPAAKRRKRAPAEEVKLRKVKLEPRG